MQGEPPAHLCARQRAPLRARRRQGACREHEAELVLSRRDPPLECAPRGRGRRGRRDGKPLGSRPRIRRLLVVADVPVSAVARGGVSNTSKISNGITIYARALVPTYSRATPLRASVMGRPWVPMAVTDDARLLAASFEAKEDGVRTGKPQLYQHEPELGLSWTRLHGDDPASAGPQRPRIILQEI